MNSTAMWTELESPHTPWWRQEQLARALMNQPSGDPALDKEDTVSNWIPNLREMDEREQDDYDRWAGNGMYAESDADPECAVCQAPLSGNYGGTDARGAELCERCYAKGETTDPDDDYVTDEEITSKGGARCACGFTAYEDSDEWRDHVCPDDQDMRRCACGFEALDDSARWIDHVCPVTEADDLDLWFAGHTIPSIDFLPLDEHQSISEGPMIHVYATPWPSVPGEWMTIDESVVPF